MAQLVKSLPAMWETQVLSLGGEDPLEKEMTTHSSILAWRIPWTEPGGLQSMGSQRVGHDWVTNTFAFHVFSKSLRDIVEEAQSSPQICMWARRQTYSLEQVRLLPPGLSEAKPWPPGSFTTPSKNPLSQQLLASNIPSTKSDKWLKLFICWQAKQVLQCQRVGASESFGHPCILQVTRPSWTSQVKFWWFILQLGPEMWVQSLQVGEWEQLLSLGLHDRGSWKWHRHWAAKRKLASAGPGLSLGSPPRSPFPDILCPAPPQRCPSASWLAARGAAAAQSGLQCPPQQSLGKEEQG